MDMIFKSPKHFESIYIANKLLNIVFFEDNDRYFTIVGNHYLVDSSKLISIYTEILIFHIYIFTRKILFFIRMMKI